jgi:hypothetical protein
MERADQSLPRYGQLARLGASAIALPLLMMIVGCGDGGGGGIASTPPPPATSTIVAAPQNASANTSLGGPLQSQSFATLAVRASTTQSSTSLVSATSSMPGGAAAISYDAASNTYTLSSPSSSASGATPDTLKLKPNDAALTSAAPVPCSSGCGGAGYLSREGTNRPSTQPYFIYSYVGYANWWSQTSSGANSVYVQNEAVFGIPTPAAAIPTTGTASYTLDVVGFEGTTPQLGSSGSHANNPTFAGGGAATLDFGSASYSMNGTTGAPTDSSKGGTGIASFSSSGKLLSGANGFGGAFTFNDAGNFDGKLNGWLFGPNAQELGAVFSASSTDGRVVVGTIVGHK